MSDDNSPELLDELIAERRGDGEMPDDMPRFMAACIRHIDTFSARVGRVVCWLAIPIMLAMVAEIILRKFFTPTIWAYDVSRMLYGVMFMLGSGYALMRGVHIRADFLYRLWAVRTQATVDFFLYLLLYFPGLLLFFWYAADYTWEGWERGERLDDTAWAPLVTPARLAMPVGVFLLLLQGVSEILKSYYAMIYGRRP